MYVGCQGFGTSRHELQFMVRHGVTHMDTTIDPDDLDQLRAGREAAAAEGVELEMIHIPMPESITMAQDPQRDRLDQAIRATERLVLNETGEINRLEGRTSSLQ